MQSLKLILLLAIGLFPLYTLMATTDQSSPQTVNINPGPEHDHGEDEGSHQESSGGEEHVEHNDEGAMDPLFFIIVALIIGASVRHFLKKSPLPFTVMLLLIGGGLGVVSRLGFFDGWADIMSRSTEWAGNISPHTILFVFLPTLIFEAAFAMDVHTFKKTAANAVILAVPGIIIALVLTAALVIGFDMFGIGLYGWGWEIALMFGAVVSATDPVAVVALLKELGASKKLGTLIEGESLLNDGTAIVIFMVIFVPLTGVVVSTSPLVQFGQVALGGILLGILIGGVTIMWVKKVFNDALVEITVIVAAAYLTFFVAEHFLHVSGVLGLVALGLAMAGVGRTRISPEVEHFLHEFWELVAFFANTLIFIIVGVVIAERTVFSANDFLLLGLIYVAIHIIRAIVILVLYPFMRKLGYGLPVKDAYVLWYGALRGAIGLALALVFAGLAYNSSIAELGFSEAEWITVQNQFLFLIAGVVALTLLINATTIKFLVDGLGLTKIPAVKAVMMATAFTELVDDTEGSLELIKGDRFLSGSNWTSVRKYLPHPVVPEISEDELASMDTQAEARRRILEKEKSSYWHQFKDGLLGPDAVRRLSDGISEMLDQGGKEALTERKYLEKLWSTPEFLNRMETIPLLGGFARQSLSDRLAMSYDIARGFVVAQEEVLKLVDSIGLDGEDMINTIKKEIGENRIRGLNYIKDLREEHPKIAVAIETKQAIRTLLNAERGTVKHLRNEGRIEEDEAERMMENVEERMKLLIDTPPSIELPEPIELLKEVTWLHGLDENTFSKVVSLVENKEYSTGTALMEQGGAGDGLFVIARGTVKVAVGDYIVDILGPGSVIGEMAVLTGVPRTATVTAESPVTALWMNTSGMQELMKDSRELEDQLWDTAGKRFAENMLGRSEAYVEWTQVQLRRWLAEGKVITGTEGESVSLENRTAILLTGNAYGTDGAAIEAPAVLEMDECTLSADARVYVHTLKTGANT